MQAIGIIPARYGSTRFPGKPLASLCGKPLIQWVWERASQSRSLSKVIVATDDRRIAEAVEKFRGEVVMTGSHHLSGTDRVAEVAGKTQADIVVNIQGDEPFVQGSMIDDLVGALEKDGEAQMATLAAPIADAAACANPNVVKVVVDQGGNALYFSRLAIPYVRTETAEDCKGHLQHIGLYGFRRDFLLEFASLEPTPLEKMESLEQLRALEHGFRIRVVTVDARLHGVDTVDDLKEVERIMMQRGICREVHRAQ